VRGIQTARQVEGRAGPVPAHLLGYLLQGLEALGQLGRPRARSIAGLFPWPPSEPDMKLVASSGSPVSFSPNPTATFIFDLRSASPYASPAYPIYSKETAYVTSLSDRR